MSISQRRFIRFSLNIPAVRQGENGENIPIILHQISIGGCMMSIDDAVFVGDEFRLKINLPNGNWLPFFCRALYKFPGKGIGVKFLEITAFEQKLLADIISHSLEIEGLPLQVDPFAHPPTFVEAGETALKEPLNQRLREENLCEEIMAFEN